MEEYKLNTYGVWYAFRTAFYFLSLRALHSLQWQRWLYWIQIIAMETLKHLPVAIFLPFIFFCCEVLLY